MKEAQTKMKSENEKYLEKASQILTCLALTESVPLDYIKVYENGKQITTRGSATKKKNGCFRINLVNDREFQVQEVDLYNDKNIDYMRISSMLVEKQMS